MKKEKRKKKEKRNDFLVVSISTGV